MRSGTECIAPQYCAIAGPDPRLEHQQRSSGLNHNAAQSPSVRAQGSSERRKRDEALFYAAEANEMSHPEESPAMNSRKGHAYDRPFSVPAAACLRIGSTIEPLPWGRRKLDTTITRIRRAGGHVKRSHACAATTDQRERNGAPRPHYGRKRSRAPRQAWRTQSRRGSTWLLPQELRGRVSSPTSCFRFGSLSAVYSSWPFRRSPPCSADRPAQTCIIDGHRTIGILATMT